LVFKGLKKVKMGTEKLRKEEERKHKKNIQKIEKTRGNKGK